MRDLLPTPKSGDLPVPKAGIEATPAAEWDHLPLAESVKPGGPPEVHPNSVLEFQVCQWHCSVILSPERCPDAFRRVCYEAACYSVLEFQV